MVARKAMVVDASRYWVCGVRGWLPLLSQSYTTPKERPSVDLSDRRYCDTRL
jgi:hypothetical protein